jgi:hypothetical protein
LREIKIKHRCLLFSSLPLLLRALTCPFSMMIWCSSSRAGYAVATVAPPSSSSQTRPNHASAGGADVDVGEVDGLEVGAGAGGADVDVGEVDGLEVGDDVGEVDGLEVGDDVGDDVGADVGEVEGLEVGASDAVKQGKSKDSRLLTITQSRPLKSTVDFVFKFVFQNARSWIFQQELASLAEASC